MKRILSVILAIALVVTLLPTFAFAAEGDAEGIRIKYDILGAVKDLGVDWESSKTEADKAKRVSFKKLDYELTKGFFKFNSASTGEFTGHSELNYNSKYGFQISSGDWISFDIFVPRAGTYTMEMWCGNYESDTKTKVYINNVEVGSYSNYEEGTVASGATSGQNNRFTKVVDEPRYIEGITFEKAGIHTVKFYGSSNYCSAGTFYLVENGTGTGSCLATMLSKPENSVLVLGNSTTTKLNVEMYMSDRTLVQDMMQYTVSYKSDNEDVATVDEQGNIVAQGKGTANITTYVINEFGMEISQSNEIAVVDGISITYDLKKHISKDIGYYQGKKVGSLSALTEDVTKGFYSYDTNSNYDYDGNKVKYYASLQLGYIGTNVSFRINVPEAGYYNIIHDVLAISPSNKYAARQNIDLEVYFSKDAISLSMDDYIGEVNAYGDNYTEGEWLKLCSGSVEIDEPGTYVITLKAGTCYGNTTEAPFVQVNSFYLVGGTKSALVNGKISSTAASINVDEGESATVSASGFLSKDSAAAEFTYSSSNTKVATVDATTGVVTPVSAGVATITATATNADVANTLTTDITVTENKPGEEVADTKISVGVVAEEGGSVETNLSEAVSEVEIGTKILAEATADEGYAFAYWADSNGAVLSTNAKESFTINVNTSIKAVFEKLVTAEDTTAPVYFYNGNGEALGSESVEKGKTFGEVTKPEATLTGFAFDKWSISNDAVINDVIRAVALFKDTNNTYTVKVGDAAVATGKKYGDSVTVSAAESDFTCWKLGDKIMSYSKDFTFNVYGDINLTKVCEGASDAIPTVVLDSIDGELFLTYNVPAGYTKLEAGILFSKTGTPSIESFNAKATEKTGSGQFTAKAHANGGNIAVGYVIFKDAEGSVRVIYAE